MYYTIYKITNQLNGKIYIGSHKTKDLDDNYMGSGKYLNHAQEKYGLVNFKKEILFVYDTPEAMYAKEAEIVNEDFLATENTYNLKIGGFGGWDYINSNGHRHVFTAKERSHAGKIGGRRTFELSVAIFAEDSKKRQKERMKELYPKSPFHGKSHTEEHKQYMSSIMGEKQSGMKNSQFGTMWITNGIESKKICKTDTIPDGWYKGRVCKLRG